LLPVIKSAKVLPLVKFSAIDFLKENEQIVQQIQSSFNSNVIVRSSSSNEDCISSSNAGRFDSIANVNSLNNSHLTTAIEQVIGSYKNTLNHKDEIFVQSMLEKVSMSGVVFSADIDTLSPYYIVNYDESGQTNRVTSGNSNDLKTFIAFKDYKVTKHPKIKKILTAVQECEKLFDNKFLDIEFAFTKEDLYILQVRAISTESKDILANIDLATSLRKISNKITKLNAPHPNLLGDKTIFGVMPDWNPAEIIGIKPKMLALSLYKELITDETWAYQRDNYGYRNLRGHPLLVSFLGVPFIDVRISFNSFIPKNLGENVATKLVNYYLDKLTQNTKSHDKIEFDIIYSCYFFGIEKKLQKLSRYNFTQDELVSISQSLLDLTNKIIDTEHGLYKKDLEKVETLKKKFDDIVKSQLPIIDKIYWLIKDVKRYGTLPFAGIARAGFIAVQILKSLVEEKIISQENYDGFLATLNTISQQLSIDSRNMSKEKFISIYGHLRPGTYDILSKRYDDSYELYFDKGSTDSTETHKDFSFTKIQKEKIEKLLKKKNLNTNFENLILFIKESIEGREYAKFLFTKHLSQVILYIEEFGARFGISKEELAHLDIQQVVNLYATLDYRDVPDILNDEIKKNAIFYNYTKAIKLPSLIVKKEDVYNFFLEDNEPNFITLKRIEASIIIEDRILSCDLDGKIICIKSADPGYDYLFSKKIGGLVTCYGGANSHMAIRCAEMGIPAVIGCGEKSFSIYSKANSILIDALNKQAKVLS
jgi:phosphoenolpyruvate synthase/pyruvate phosphate dikinase